MDNYEVEIHGVKKKVSVVADVAVIDQERSQLRKLMQRKVMGFDIKVDKQ